MPWPCCQVCRHVPSCPDRHVVRSGQLNTHTGGTCRWVACRSYGCFLACSQGCRGSLTCRHRHLEQHGIRNTDSLPAFMCCPASLPVPALLLLSPPPCRGCLVPLSSLWCHQTTLMPGSLGPGELNAASLVLLPASLALERPFQRVLPASRSCSAYAFAFGGPCLVASSMLQP